MSSLKEKVIVDGDWGGDEMQLLSVLLAHPDQVEILALTCVFGNTNLPQLVRNAAAIMDLLNAPESLPLYAGAAAPSDSKAPEGDNAHGSSGTGKAVLKESSRPIQPERAADFILDTLRNHPPGTITITATGPLINIAEALRKDPETLRRVKRILIMGGCTEAMPAKDRPSRQGNISPYAEFNFFMAPTDAKIVMESDLPLVLFPLNCTHQMPFPEERKQRVRERLFFCPETAEEIVKMMSAPEPLDLVKFGIPALLHDVQTAFHLIAPTAHEGRRGFVKITATGEEKGLSVFEPSENGNVLVMEKIKNPDALFEILLGSLHENLAKGCHHVEARRAVSSPGQNPTNVQGVLSPPAKPAC